MQAKMAYASPLGAMTLLADETGVLGAWFDDQRYFGGQFDLAAAPVQTTAPLKQAAAWLDAYFDGAAPNSQDVPLHLTGTPFRQAVMQALLTIPYGDVVTYHDLAARLVPLLGRRTAARPVGGAVGHNPISVIVPCHRVVGQDGGLVGYAGGLDRKMMLLGLEGHRIDVDRRRLLAAKPVISPAP